MEKKSSTLVKQDGAFEIREYFRSPGATAYFVILRASNGIVLFKTSDYFSKAAAENAITSIRKNSAK